MHRSHQVPQLQGMTNCLLQLVSPPTRRASYLTTWACCGGRTPGQATCISTARLGLEVKQGQTIINGLNYVVIEEKLYYIGDSGSGECILFLLARRYVTRSASSRWTSDED